MLPLRFIYDLSQQAWVIDNHDGRTLLSSHAPPPISTTHTEWLVPIPTIIYIHLSVSRELVDLIGHSSLGSRETIISYQAT